jgi:hypothetical protein
MMIQSLEPIKQFFDALSPRKFRVYALWYIGIIALLMVLLTYYNYSSQLGWKKMFYVLNEDRQTVQDILETAALVNAEKIHINEMLAQDPNFKIGGYFNEVVQRLNLANKQSTIETLPATDIGDGYFETVLTAKFVGMTMQHIAELLQAVESNERIHITKLIVKREQDQKSLEAEMTITTILLGSSVP